MPERKPVKKNVYADIFETAYETKYGLPYQRRTHDFVQLNRLLRDGPLASRMTTDVFRRGVTNYLASDLGMHTLADLCTRFVPFWRGSIDRYGKPKVERKNNGFTQASYGESSWVFRFLKKVNEAKLSKEQEEKLYGLLDATENGQIGETEALQRLEAIQNESSRAANQEAQPSNRSSS